MTDVEVETTTDEVAQACARAARAAVDWAARPRAERAGVLRAIADALEGDGPGLIELAAAETRLPAGRLTGELARTTFQLRAFADDVADGGYLGRIVTEADPRPLPQGHPELRRLLVPLGPVAVYAASNFPFAFGVAGGDTASALAAGCPVVVKAHPGHPGLSRRIGDLITAAVATDGVFALVAGFEAGRALVLDPNIEAAAFTGSYQGGRALFDLAVNRPRPIPFMGELGSVNPVVVTPGAGRRMAELIPDYLESLTVAGGQLCTNPGLLIVPSGTAALAVAAAEGVPAAPLLGSRFAELFDERFHALTEIPGARTVLTPTSDDSDGHRRGPGLVSVAARDALGALDAVQTECFGPAGVIVEYDDTDELLKLVAGLHGCLAMTVHGEQDEPLAATLVTAAARIAGRVVWNGWPTGVAVAPAQQHGGPFPSTTDSRHTSVGSTAIARFLRPVTYQSVPRSLLPPDLRS
jgi:NADP-dependent aldehyde dehydrogenase